MKKDYIEEKEALALKLYDILALKNNYFLLCELDKDEIKQEQIMNLVPDIKKFFKTKDFCFLNFKDQNRLKKPYMSIIRGVLKFMKYQFIMETVNIRLNDSEKDNDSNNDKTSDINNENKKSRIRTQKYYIFKPNETIRLSTD